MAERPFDPLAEYVDPPVAETVLSAKFRDIPGLDQLRIVEFWNRKLRNRASNPLPKSETQPLYPMPVELFGQNQSFVPPQIRIRSGIIPSRYWFKSESGDELVQVQQDWLAVNWRRESEVEGPSPYVRFPQRVLQFRQNWESLSEYLDEDGLGSLSAVQCEVTYINHIPIGDGGISSFSHTNEVTSLVGITPTEIPAKTQSVNFLTNFTIDSDEGKPFARLHIQINSAIHNITKEEMLVINLTFRGRPFSSNLDGVTGFFESGHNWIVGTFDLITTSRMHGIWLRKEQA